MPTLAQTDVGAVVRSMNDLYQPDGRCSKIADRSMMQLLINSLRGYTDVVEAKAVSEGLTTDTVQAQWMKDMANWRLRLASYQAGVSASVSPALTLASCEEIYPTVVGPLLDGVYSGSPVTDGIVNPAKPTVPDVAMPYMLGNQVIVYGEFQSQNFGALVGYFTEEGERVMASLGGAAKRALKVAAPSVLMIGIGIAIAAVAVTYMKKELMK